MSDRMPERVTGGVSGRDIPTLSDKPPGWCMLTTGHQTPFYALISEISAYGTAPVGLGNAWITFKGTFERQYVLETMDEIAAIIAAG